MTPADVADDDDVRRAVAAAVERHGRLDVVVGDAGVVAYGRIEDVPVEVFDAVLATNLHGPVNLVRHVLPVLRGQEDGSLVLVGSLIGHIAVPDMAAYVAEQVGRPRRWCASCGSTTATGPALRFGYVAPGGVDTPIYEQAATYGDAVGTSAVPGADARARSRRGCWRSPTRPWRGGQSGLANDVIRVRLHGPAVAYDRRGDPLFTVAAQDLEREPWCRGPATCWSPGSEGNALRGDARQRPGRRRPQPGGTAADDGEATDA